MLCLKTCYNHEVLGINTSQQKYFRMKRLALLLLVIFAFSSMMKIDAQSSFPPKKFPASIKVLTDAGVAQYWDVKRIMCIGRANGGYKFRIYGNANADHRSQSVKMYYILPGNRLQIAGAYFFPAIKAGESFNFEIVSAYKGHAPAKFQGFMIMDEWLKTPEGDVPNKEQEESKSEEQKTDIKVPEVPEEVLATVQVSQISLVDEVKNAAESYFNNEHTVTKEDLDTDPKSKVKEEDVFEAVDEMPEFPGGLHAMMTWLGENIRYPAAAVENNVQGRVIVRFIVEKNGTVTNPIIVRGVGKDLDSEALRVVKALPQLIPGKKNGQPVRTHFSLPINFKLDRK